MLKVYIFTISNRLTASPILSFTSSFARSRVWFRVPTSFNLCTHGGEDMDWTDLAWDGEGWRALVNAVMNLRVP
jgi:hypothetical protein